MQATWRRSPTKTCVNWNASISVIVKHTPTEVSENVAYMYVHTNLHPISHRSQVIAGYWSNFLSTEVPVFNSLVILPETHEHEIWPQDTRNIALSLSYVQHVFRLLEPFSRGSRVWQTDRQTNIQTNRQTEPALAIVRCNDLG